MTGCAQQSAATAKALACPAEVVAAIPPASTGTVSDGHQYPEVQTQPISTDRRRARARSGTRQLTAAVAKHPASKKHGLDAPCSQMVPNRKQKAVSALSGAPKGLTEKLGPGQPLRLVLVSGQQFKLIFHPTCSHHVSNRM